jgi:hypothetical protein
MTRMRVCAWVVVAIAAMAPLASAGTGELHANEILFAGQRVTSGCYYRLEMQANGNLVTMGGATQLWASNTAWVGAYATVRDGFVSVHDWSGRVVWSIGMSQTGCGPEVAIFNGGVCPVSNHLQQQDDGNLVHIWEGQAQWSSGVAQQWRIQSCASTPELKTRVSSQYDFRGGDYQAIEMSAPMPVWCGYYCSQDARCKAYTYVPPGVKGPNAMCYLKDGPFVTREAGGMYSGRIIGR